MVMTALTGTVSPAGAANSAANAGAGGDDSAGEGAFQALLGGMGTSDDATRETGTRDAGLLSGLADAQGEESADATSLDPAMEMLLLCGVLPPSDQALPPATPPLTSSLQAGSASLSGAEAALIAVAPGSASVAASAYDASTQASIQANPGVANLLAANSIVAPAEELAAGMSASQSTSQGDLPWLQAKARALLEKTAGATQPAAPRVVDDVSLAQLAKQVDPATALTPEVLGKLLESAPMAALMQGVRDERNAAATDSIQTSSTVANALSTAALQPASTQLADDAGALDTPIQLQTSVGSQQWATELGNKLTLLASRETQSATLYMTPADLGPVQVRIDTSQDQASVWFTAENAETRSALEQSLPRLRELFAAQGMSLTDAGVFDNPSRQRAYTPEANPFAAEAYQDDEDLADTATVRSLSLSLLDAYA